MIEKDPAKNINPALTTNGTWDQVHTTKSSETKQQCNPSADGVGPVKLSKTNADWDPVWPNILDMKKNIEQIYILCTPQALNNHLLDDIRDFFKQHDIHCVFNQPVYSPSWMKPEALDNPLLRNKFIEQMTLLDQIHGTDYREFMP